MSKEIQVAPQTKIVEIGGSQFEVAILRKTEAFKIGDHVKLLEKSGGTYEVHAGIITGFACFESLPTVTVAYVKTDYYGTRLKFVSINKACENYEIAAMGAERIEVDKARILARFDADIERHRAELEKAEAQKAWFVTNYGRYFDLEVE